MKAIAGGVVAPVGFRAAGVACGVKASGLDLALIVPQDPASAAGLFTTNRVQAAPVLVSRAHLERSGGFASIVAVNSGCANACTGEAGLEAARRMAATAARAVRCPVEQALVASTGVIGTPLPIDLVERGVGAAISALGHEGLPAAQAIMTTDVCPKESAVEVVTDTGAFRVGGMAKGAGMIEPNLATMLAFLTTDAAIDPPRLRRAVAAAARNTFNAITVDGECSTNDCVLALAGGASGVHIDDALYPAFVEALTAVSRDLALAIVRGGEGATKLVAVRVCGARSDDDARQAARTVANSPLVKTAVHGADPNWGRLLSAAGRAGVELRLDCAAVRIGPITLFAKGRPFDDRAPAAADHLRGDRIEIELQLGTGGKGQATVWTCDLSADYVRINADYRT